MPTNRVHRIAVIPGDGIGKEVMPEGVRVLEAAAKKFGFELRLDDFDFASCDYYAKHERMMPEDWKELIGKHDAIYFGAVGMPDKVPDHVSLWGSLILFRREFDQYVNLRPVRRHLAWPLLPLRDYLLQLKFHFYLHLHRPQEMLLKTLLKQVLSFFRES